MQCAIFRPFARREGGARKVIRDMRYMWSEMDSGLGRPKRFQPSRGVVFRRDRRWRKGRGVVAVAAAGADGDAVVVVVVVEVVEVVWAADGGREYLMGRGGWRVERVWERDHGSLLGSG